MTLGAGELVFHTTLLPVKNPAAQRAGLLSFPWTPAA